MPRNFVKSLARRFVPDLPRQFASTLLRHVFRSYWKRVAFSQIDQTALCALSKKKFFEPELKLLPLFISSPGFVFDVGANLGEYTYVLEKVVGPEYVYAIEPLPHLSVSLRKLFPQVHVLKMALSDAEGTLKLKTPIINGTPLWTRSTLEGFVDVGETDSLTEEVPVLPLDTLCKQLGLNNVRLIKIDVEGHEKKVLIGALQTLKTHRPVLLVEIEQRHHQESISEIFSWIQEQGYYGLFFDTETMSLRSIRNFSTATHQKVEHLGGVGYVNNFLFLDELTAPSLTEAASQAIDKGI